MQNCVSDHNVVPVLSNLYDHCPACIRRSSGAEALVADGSEEYGHSGEFRTGDPALISNREGENDEENGHNKVEVWFKVVPAKVGLCLLHIQAGFKTCQKRCQGSEVLPSL